MPVRPKPAFKPEVLLFAFFGVGIFFMLLNLAAAIQTLGAFRRVVRDQDVQSTLRTARTRLEEADAGQAGFLLTGDTTYLQAVSAAQDSLPPAYAHLADIAVDNASRQAHLQAVRRFGEARLAAIVSTVALARAGHRDAALARLVPGRALMDSLREVSAVALAAEDGALARGQSIVQHQLARRRVLSYGILVGAILALIGVVLLSARLRRIQAFVTLCAWSKAIQYEGEWMSFETYLVRRFDISVSHGMSPAALEAMAAQDPAGAPGGGWV